MSDTLKNDYHLCEELGRGRFGVVHRCYSPISAASYACKSIAKHTISSDPTDRRCLDVEPEILRLLSSCPNILHLHDVYDDDDHLHLVTDLCDGGDLFDRLASGARFSEPEAAAVLRQLMLALAFCHRAGVAHRDIKPDNILFDSCGLLKLADFGSAEVFGVASEMRGVVGTPYYVAPEVLMGDNYNEKVDIWSAGVILYMMLGGVAPFYGDGPAETFEAVLRSRLKFPTKNFRSISPEAIDLMRKMICRDVHRRLSAEQVLRHPWTMNGGNTKLFSD